MHEGAPSIKIDIGNMTVGYVLISQCLRAIYNEAYLVYVSFMPYRLHFHQKLRVWFTYLVTVTRW